MFPIALLIGLPLLMHGSPIEWMEDIVDVADRPPCPPHLVENEVERVCVERDETCVLSVRISSGDPDESGACSFRSEDGETAYEVTYDGSGRVALAIEPPDGEATGHRRWEERMPYKERHTWQGPVGVWTVRLSVADGRGSGQVTAFG